MADEFSRVEAEEFFAQYARETGADVTARLPTAAGPGVDHTYEELVFGARVAWRNALDCIGKAHWRQLSVRDARHAVGVEEIVEACVSHLKEATNGGKIQLVMTIFPPRAPNSCGIKIWNRQLISYAGYPTSSGAVIGDPQTVGLTALARSLGWRGKGSRFDILPLVIQMPGEMPRAFDLPPDSVVEIPLRHPTLRWFSSLGLRWYAHPALSNMLMRIGGVDYTAAPFSGWYTCTEIAARNLSDTSRFNVLPMIAERMNLDTRSNRTLWVDRALVELMTAVMHSYDADGVTIVDHRFIGGSFVRHELREQRAGRSVNANWRSLVAPTSASTTATFDRHYPTEFVLPNFLPQLQVSDAAARRLASQAQHREESRHRAITTPGITHPAPSRSSLVPPDPQ